jgi:hypothetical protein
MRMRAMCSITRAPSFLSRWGGHAVNIDCSDFGSAGRKFGAHKAHLANLVQQNAGCI